MGKTNHLYPVLVRKYGKEDTEIAEKTWPLAIPSQQRLVAVLSDKEPGSTQGIEIALDITETDRYMRYIEQVRNGKWSSLRIYYVPEHSIEHCRMRYDS